MLYGKIEYNRNISNERFKGFIKLKKDPKGEEISDINLIYREEVNFNAEWMYGIVLYTGNNTKFSLQS